MKIEQPATEEAKAPFPPHAQLLNFLPEPDVGALFDWAIAQEAQFKPAKILYGEGGRESGLRPSVRQTLKHCGLGELEPMMRARMFERLPEIIAAAGYRGAEPRSIEFELNAYGDGAHFAPHIDIPVGGSRRTVGYEEGEDRVISAVYYFHRLPKAYSGGALRLFRFGVGPADVCASDSIAFQPIHNSVVVFPSWAMHQVEPVSCPSGRFADFRFGLNCWFCRRLSS